MNSCKTCGKETPNLKYCSHSCAAVENNRLYPKRVKMPKREHPCIQCQALTYNAKYCSLDCQQAYQSQQLIASGVYSERTLRAYLRRIHKCCAVCSLERWQNQPIPLELDHIDGNAQNNSLDNARLICPNCHAQTLTYKGKNVGNGRAFRRQRYREGKSY